MAIGSVATPQQSVADSQKPDDTEVEGEIISSLTTTPEKIGSEVAIGSVATPQQSPADLQKPDETEVEEGEIIDETDEGTSSPSVITTLEKTGSVAPQQADADANTQSPTPTSEVAIGSVATTQQAPADANTQPTSKVAMASVVTPQHPAADTNANQSSNKGNKSNESNVAADTIVDWGTYKEPNDNTDNQDTDAQQKRFDTDKIRYEPITHALPDLDATETTLCISNISSDIKRQDLIQLLGLNTTPYSRKTVRLKLFFNTWGKYKAYALATAPKFVTDRLTDLNGMKFNSRQLSIELANVDKSSTLYDRVAMQRGLRGQSHFPSSGNKKAKGDPRPVSNASSRQEESMPSINRVEDELGGTWRGQGEDQILYQMKNSWHKLSGRNRTDSCRKGKDANCSLTSRVTMKALLSQAPT